MSFCLLENLILFWDYMIHSSACSVVIKTRGPQALAVTRVLQPIGGPVRDRVSCLHFKVSFWSPNSNLRFLWLFSVLIDVCKHQVIKFCLGGGGIKVRSKKLLEIGKETCRHLMSKMKICTQECLYLIAWTHF